MSITRSQPTHVPDQRQAEPDVPLPPTPPPPARSWYRSSWLPPIAAGLLGLSLGAGIAAGGPSEEQLTAAETRADDTAADLAAMQMRLDSARDAAVQSSEMAQQAAAEAEAALKSDMDKLAADQKALADKTAAAEKALADKTAAANAALDAREAKVSTMESVAKANEFDGDGIYLIPSDVKPGTYKAGPSTSGNCYYARLTGPGGEIIDNGNTSGPVVVTVRPSDGALEVSGCQTFRKVG